MTSLRGTNSAVHGNNSNEYKGLKEVMEATSTCWQTKNNNFVKIDSTVKLAQHFRNAQVSSKLCTLDGYYSDENQLLVLYKETTTMFPQSLNATGLDWQQIKLTPPPVVVLAPTNLETNSKIVPDNIQIMAENAAADKQGREDRKAILNTNGMPPEVKEAYERYDRVDIIL